MKLREWQYMSKPAASNSSASYKKRFEKLIKYHIDHASSELESITKKDIKDDSFHLTEHYKNVNHEFDRDVIVSVDTKTNTFFLTSFINGKEVESLQRDSWEEFLKLLDLFLFLPDEGTSDYDDLLVEWVLMKGSQTPSRSTTSTSSKTNKEKFKELTDYMMKHKGSLTARAEVPEVDDNGFTYKEHWASTATSGKGYVLTLIVNYSRFNSSWRYELYMDTSLIKEAKGSGWEDLLEELEKYFHVPKAGSQEYRSLTEAASSIADDFKLYENLWD